MHIGPRPSVIVRHGFAGGQTASMNLVIVMTAVQNPNMGCTQHCGCPIVTGAFVHGSFAVALLIRGTQVVCAKIRGMTGDVVSVFVIDDSCVVRGVGTIAPARRLDKRTMLQQLPAWPEVNLACGGNGIVLRQFVPSAWQTVVASLERQPVVAASHPIAKAVVLRSGMVGSYYHCDPGQWCRTQFDE